MGPEAIHEHGPADGGCDAEWQRSIRKRARQRSNEGANGLTLSEGPRATVEFLNNPRARGSTNAATPSRWSWEREVVSFRVGATHATTIPDNRFSEKGFQTVRLRFACKGSSRLPVRLYGQAVQSLQLHGLRLFDSLQAVNGLRENQRWN